MMKKDKLLISIFVICLIMTGCGTKDITSAGKTGNNNIAGNMNAQAPGETDTDIKSNDDGKLKLSHNEMLAYNGYMDSVESWFGTKYELSDYDNDGLTDRVYREASYTEPSKKSQGLVPDKVSFRIDFGNGDSLELGMFDDAFLGIKIIGADLTGDGNNEIIFLGHHDAMTEPESYSETAVFRKTGAEYERISLPAPVDDTTSDKYLAGYPVYAKNDTDSEITLFADYVNYEEVIQIERNDNNRDVRYRDNDLISSYAWGIGTEKYEDKTAFVLYQKIGGRNYYKNNLKILLLWQDDEFKPVKMETVDQHYEW
ncbi:hypothetical protein [Anaerocolumna xylanovorans]|uniref:Uncharacterized protein n=1 Tax=Anaerocolumna xylanovorans DSM 12503 TaxID=1121345 RepID=A0A1M7YNN1_9FIRM|nr:hypothetical protein [Anaerocolumna xylanovorans]SHO54221.1 hypothetical protein SAMN02745217_04678 [Anaerocolumna xylanovorans DSM 12503]